MSIWASFDGIDCWDCKRGCKECGHVGLPYEYGHSGMLPHARRPRSGGVDLAYLSKFVRFYRNHPNTTKPAPEGIEPWLRLGLDGDGAYATVVLDRRQVEALRARLGDWLRWVDGETE